MTSGKIIMKHKEQIEERGGRERGGGKRRRRRRRRSYGASLKIAWDTCSQKKKSIGGSYGSSL